MSNLVQQFSPLSSPNNDLKQQKRYISRSKFIRTPQSQKLDKKKVQHKQKEEQRICFISPNRLKKFYTLQNQLNNADYNHSPQKPNFLHELSKIQNNTQSNLNQAQKINESLLSIYQELNSGNQRNREAEVQLLRQQLQIIKAKVDQERLIKDIALQKLKDFEYLQRFLMGRETKICEISQKNIFLNEKMLKVQKQKEVIQKQLVDFQDSYKENLKRYEVQISDYKSKCNRLYQENKFLIQLKDQLKTQIQELKIQSNQFNTGIEISINQNTKKSQQVQTLDLRTRNQDVRIYNQFDIGSNLLLKEVQISQNKTIQLQAQTCQQLLSTRSNHLHIQVSFDQEGNEDKCRWERGCSCGWLINRLNQKIRYNQIEIDILKKMKGRGELVQKDNEMLKKKIQSLTQRVEYLSDKKKDKKKENKKRPSDSSLQFSLSPRKNNIVDRK